MIVICFAILLAVFGYFIAPDNSPYANRIIPAIANQQAGFEIELLRVKRIRLLSATLVFSSECSMVKTMLICLCRWLHTS